MRDQPRLVSDGCRKIAGLARLFIQLPKQSDPLDVALVAHQNCILATTTTMFFYQECRWSDLDF